MFVSKIDNTGYYCWVLACGVIWLEGEDAQVTQNSSAASVYTARRCLSFSGKGSK